MTRAKGKGEGEGDARYLDAGGRLRRGPSDLLVETAFRRELAYAGALYEGISYADLAHVLMLAEAGVIPEAPAAALLAALVELHDQGLAALKLDAKWGDLYNNRDSELQRRVPAAAGWLHAGRARREALTLGWLIHQRVGLAAVRRDTAALLRVLADLGARHAADVMPDFTYLQHAQPTTLGHFLLGFAAPLRRDAQRLALEAALLDESPAGAASTNGARLPLDRERMRALLGFATVNVHSRDAMWRADVAINLMGVLVSIATDVARLAEELQLWATDEFGYATLADEHCRASVIMPNKKNPYALSFIRGQAREIDGALMSVIATNQTPSGQIDNRNTSYDALPRGLESVDGLVRLLAEVLERMTLDVGRLREQARHGHTYGTELADLLLLRERIDARTAHEIVGATISAQVASPPRPFAVALAEAFQAAVGRPLAVGADELWREVQPEQVVANRLGIGSCAPDTVRAMAADLRAAADVLAAAVDEEERRSQFPALLRQAVAERLGRKW
ncbi:MAG TPA: lyase family protein [Candidatus Dormibacteraeota bacterium]|nr:lyase family protein [Candidatus Dormibacteraeota bacterium]